MSWMEQKKTSRVINRPALRYFGGKWRLAPWIISHFPRHTTYVEVFGGGASVLLRKMPARVEVYNDVADAVVNFFRVVRTRGNELVEALRLTPFAVEEYNSCRLQRGDDLERARRYFVRSWGGHCGTNGSARNRGWRRTPDRDVASQMAGAAESLHDVCMRLRCVAIDQRDWREIFAAYDRPTTLFYVDPPYVKETRKRHAPSDGYGEHDMDEDEHEELVARLLTLQGKVVLSGYASQIYDEKLAGWTRAEYGKEVLWVKE